MMEGNRSISLKGVSKTFRVFDRGLDRLVEAASLGRARRGRDFWALKDINLEVERGATMGILGRNGAGKSTLLRVVSGNLMPTSGSVKLVGQPILLQMGAGFNPDYTGRENVMLNGLVLGMERKKILERFDEIEAFADIGDFIDQPVRMYSSGMKSRLGFAVAVNVEPDVLIVDETLSVGDAVFKQMGLQKMRDLRDRGSTILLVSHSMKTVRNFCTQAALIHEGQLIARGETSEVADEYQALLTSTSKKKGYVPNEEEDDEAVEDFFEQGESAQRTGMRRGTGEVRITNVEVLDVDDRPAGLLRPDDLARIRLHLRSEADVGNFAAGITLRNNVGLEVFATDTVREGVKLDGRKGERMIVDFDVKLPLQPGSYGIVAQTSPAKNRADHYDWIGVAATLSLHKIEREDAIPGLVRLPTKTGVTYPDR